MMKTKITLVMMMGIDEFINERFCLSLPKNILILNLINLECINNLYFKYIYKLQSTRFEHINNSEFITEYKLSL